MAIRPVFYVRQTCPYFNEEPVEFPYAPGFAVIQKQKNIYSLHREFLRKHENARIIEVSSKSENPIGVQLSAFNLSLVINGQKTTVESAFQSSKVFQNGGPYTDLLYMPSHIAKNDPRLREHGPLIGFRLNNEDFPLEPKTLFYDWLYLNAVSKDRILSDRICDYNSFTDIEFNPKKSINCQARSAAMFVSLRTTGMLKSALKDIQQFRDIVYGLPNASIEEQMSLFE